MRLNKEKFLKTEFGAELKNCILCWDAALELKDNKTAQWCQAQWEVYQMALKQFYSVEPFKILNTAKCPYLRCFCRS